MKVRFSPFILASALSLALPARAQPGLSAESASARTDYRRALAEMDKGNWEPARGILADLFKRSPTFDVAASLGEAEAKLGLYPQAAHHFAFALKNVPPKEKADTSARIRAGLNEVTAKVATVRVSIEPEDAQLFVDGEAVATFSTSPEVFLSPGKRVLEARSGQASATREIDAVAGKDLSIALEIVEAPASGLPPPVAPGGTTAASPAPFEAVQPPPTGSDRTTWAPTLVAGGLTIVALSIGAGFALDASAAQSDSDEKLKQARAAFGPTNPCAPARGQGSGYCDDLASLKSRRDRSRTASTVSFVVGGVLAAGAVGSYFLWASGPDRASSSAKVSAAVGGGSASLLLEGKF